MVAMAREAHQLAAAVLFVDLQLADVVSVEPRRGRVRARSALSSLEPPSPPRAAVGQQHDQPAALLGEHSLQLVGPAIRDAELLTQRRDSLGQCIRQSASLYPSASGVWRPTWCERF